MGARPDGGGEAVEVPLEGGEQAGQLEAEGDGDGLLEVGARGERGALVLLGQCAQVRDDGLERLGVQVERVAQLQGGRRVGHVLCRRAPVRVFAVLRARRRGGVGGGDELLDDGQDGVADQVGVLFELWPGDGGEGAVLLD